MVQSWKTPDNGERIAFELAVLTPLNMLLAAVLSIGLWRLQDWARYGVALFGMWGLFDRAIVATVLAPATISDTVKSNFSPAGMARILILIAVIGYLYQPRVANSFSDTSR